MFYILLPDNAQASNVIKHGVNRMTGSLYISVQDTLPHTDPRKHTGLVNL